MRCYAVCTRTGIRLMPFTKFERIRSTGPASSIDRRKRSKHMASMRNVRTVSTTAASTS